MRGVARCLPTVLTSHSKITIWNGSAMVLPPWITASKNGWLWRGWGRRDGGRDRHQQTSWTRWRRTANCRSPRLVGATAQGEEEGEIRRLTTMLGESMRRRCVPGS